MFNSRQQKKHFFEYICISFKINIVSNFLFIYFFKDYLAVLDTDDI